MDSETPSSHTATAGDPRWFSGCAIAALVLAGLMVFGAVELMNVEKGLDGYGQLEQAGSSGSAAEPLGAGETAQYEDGLKVTVSAPRAEADGTYEFSVIYDNGTDHQLRPGGQSFDDSVSDLGPAPLVVRPGRSLDDYVSDFDLTLLDGQTSASALLPPLGAGGKRTVPVRIKPTRAGIPFTVEVAPPDAGYRDTAYFQLTAG
ncbi:hypothetical protein AB0N17_35315 [Streptomyces sp. NPDC051133]|uniref:hypothetical protein n=1 Tax=Streptomyces sp. NPDC051133 TaxID=3155521 RepID=UPI0034261590